MFVFLFGMALLFFLSVIIVLFWSFLFSKSLRKKVEVRRQVVLIPLENTLLKDLFLGSLLHKAFIRRGLNSFQV